MLSQRLAPPVVIKRCVALRWIRDCRGICERAGPWGPLQRASCQDDRLSPPSLLFLLHSESPRQLLEISISPLLAESPGPRDSSAFFHVPWPNGVLAPPGISPAKGSDLEPPSPPSPPSSAPPPRMPAHARQQPQVTASARSWGRSPGAARTRRHRHRDRPAGH